MKVGIHPKLFATKVSCACGNSFVIDSTVEEIKVEVCNKCHPFYTGTMKYVDTAGRVDAFKTKMKGVKKNLLTKTEKRQLKKEEKLKKEMSTPETLAELRKQVKKG